MTGLSEIVTQSEPAALQWNAPPSQGATEEHANSWAGAEKRRERRYPTCDPVEVFLVDFAGVRVSGMLRDVSRDGFRVEIDLPVHRGARLKVRLRDHTTVFAVARYCRRTADTYQVGAEIEWLYCSRNTPPQSVHTDAAHGPAHECYKLATAIVDFHMFPWVEIIDETRPRMRPISDAGV